MSQKIFTSIEQTIGNTPLVKLRTKPANCLADIVLKLEFFNPLFSVKDRIAKAMILDAEAKGLLTKGMHIIEPTSGNTGIGLAFVAASMGYKITLVMPESMSMERRILPRMLGANIVITPAGKGMSGAIAVAQKLITQTPNSYMPNQFENPANPKVHFDTTAEEIWRDTDGKVDIVVAGVGTGGTITGIGENLKGKNAAIQMIAVEPQESQILAGGTHSPHKIQGIGAGFIPKNLNTKIYNEVVAISSTEALETSQQITQLEGIPLGISSGAAIAAAYKIGAKPENHGKLMIVICASSTERYLSTVLAEKARQEMAALTVTEP